MINCLYQVAEWPRKLSKNPLPKFAVMVDVFLRLRSFDYSWINLLCRSKGTGGLEFYIIFADYSNPEVLAVPVAGATHQKKYKANEQKP